MNEDNTKTYSKNRVHPILNFTMKQFIEENEPSKTQLYNHYLIKGFKLCNIQHTLSYVLSYKRIAISPQGEYYAY